jgi:hypothetical protein
LQPAQKHTPQPRRLTDSGWGWEQWRWVRHCFWAAAVLRWPPASGDIQPTGGTCVGRERGPIDRAHSRGNEGRASASRLAANQKDRVVVETWSRRDGVSQVEVVRGVALQLLPPQQSAR